jgi:hypothetical protein
MSNRVTHRRMPQTIRGVSNIERSLLINVTILANIAKEFNVPAVLTAVETESFSGYIPQPNLERPKRRPEP